jgi:transaldolase/glucose-6-phosphate isomerase
MGWLDIASHQLAGLERLAPVVEAAGSSRFAHALLLGMGGSSLCPEVMAVTFGKIDGSPELHVLDSTDPAQVRSFENRIDPRRTLFIVSSKSGTTLEPNILKQYFFDRIERLIGRAEAGSRFIAITDPESKMQQIAERDGFHRVFFGRPTIGGRYSALSDFGVVPAAIMGIDVRKVLERADGMASACRPSVPIEENPGVVLGVTLGVAAREFGRDKVTLVASPDIQHVGAWLEQLLAESTGKQGKGLIPVDRETPGSPGDYGGDRVFVYLRFAPAPDASQEHSVDALERGGHPVVRIDLEDRHDLGAEFFRWEIATAVAGSVLGINPFDQPDVEASKVATRRLTDRYEETGYLPTEMPFFSGNGIELFADAKNAAALAEAASQDRTLTGYLKAHLNRIGPGDYFAILAYLEMNATHDRALQTMRHAVRDKKCAATSLGFGPRFLHSTGQAYKGGPNTGVFLQVTCEDALDLPVPGQKYTLGVVKAAQARGDFEVLADRSRRALRAHLGPNVAVGLRVLQAALLAALEP